MEIFFTKLNKLEGIEKKINKLDTIESGLESLYKKLNTIENTVASLRCDMNATKEKQEVLEETVNDFKESVNFNNARVDSLELKWFRFESPVQAKEDLRTRSLYSLAT